MPTSEEAGDKNINAPHSQGFINNPRGPVTQHFGNVTIQQGATVDQIVDAVRKAGLLQSLTTLLPESSYRELLDVFAGTSLRDVGPRLYKACSAALPVTARLVNSDTPARLIGDMYGQPQTKPWPPLFECVERFAGENGVPARLASSLRSWVDSYAALASLPVSPQEIERMRAELRAEAQRHKQNQCSWLQVCLEPDTMNRTQERKQPLFRVELVLWTARTDGGLVLSTVPDAAGSADAPRLWTLDELPALLDQAYNRRETLALIPDATRLIIEIIAPSDALLYAFEHWKRNKAETYGTTYALVVRLQDRFTIPDYQDQKLAHDRWDRKWSAFRSCAGQNKCDSIQWQAANQLDLYALQDDDDLTCLGLSSPLMHGCREVFETLRDAGIPIALFVRGGDLASASLQNWSEQIAPFINDKPLSDLQRAVMQVRRKAVGKNTAHFGNALALLWDDPERAPLKYEAKGAFV